MTIKANAQIPNSGFENWTTVGGYEDPTGWGTMSITSAGSFYSCTKSTDHYPASVGNYSIRLENNTSLTKMTGGWGVATTDTAFKHRPSFPMVGHPDSLCGYYKYNSLNNDSMAIRIILYENGTMTYNREFVTGITTSTWKPFTLPLDYTSADSATIQLMAFYPDSQTSNPKGNSVLYVDNLSFDSLITSVTYRNSRSPDPASNIVNLFNPSSAGISFTLTSNSCVSLKVFDLRGREMATLVNNEMMPAGTYTKRWYSSATSSGLYLYRLQAGSSTVTAKALR
jgi:hypothetical protein